MTLTDNQTHTWHDHKQCEIKNLICVHVGMVIIGEAGKSMRYAVNI